MQSVFEVYYLTVTGVGVGCSQYLRFTIRLSLEWVLDAVSI